MTGEIRGKPTVPTAVPKAWRGPLPDLSLQRRLPELDGYVEVPISLLKGGFRDLGVVVWAWLRLRFDERAGVTNYRFLAEALGLSGLTDGAVEQRFGAAIKPLLGTWIERIRVGPGRLRYRAIAP